MSDLPAKPAPFLRLPAPFAAVVLLAAALAGCASVTRPLPPAMATTPERPYSIHAPELPGVGTLADLPGWAADDHVAALLAFRRGCVVARDPALQAVCTRAQRLARIDQESAGAFFVENFRPEPLPGAGLLTAYFAPVYPARSEADAVFSAPVRGRPSDLVLADPGPGDPPAKRVAKLATADSLAPYPDRATIEATRPPDGASAWMRPEDLFLLQIQGSGELVFPGGRRLKAVYAADNGRPFVAVAPLMVRDGLIAPEHASSEAIRAWLAAHHGPEAQAVMDLDPRYVFFSLVPDDGRDPAGAAGVPLFPGRSVAVDPAWHAYGEPLWIDAVSPVLAGAPKTYRRLVMALDTGSAIKGEIRADLYLGRGDEAGLEAGRVRHTLLIVRLVPIGATPSPLPR